MPPLIHPPSSSVQGSKRSFRQDAEAAPPRAARTKRTSGRLGGCDRVSSRLFRLMHFYWRIPHFNICVCSYGDSPLGGALQSLFFFFSRLSFWLCPHRQSIMSHSVFQSRSLCTSPLPEPSPPLTSSSSSSSPSEWGSQNRSASPARPGQASPLPYQNQDHQRQCRPQNTPTASQRRLFLQVFNNNLILLLQCTCPEVPAPFPSAPRRRGLWRQPSQNTSTLTSKVDSTTGERPPGEETSLGLSGSVLTRLCVSPPDAW